MPAEKIHHATFTITRDFNAPPTRVYAAHIEHDAKMRWFVEGEGFSTNQYTLDARPHGWEIWRGAYQGGPEITNNTLYFELTPDERIIFAYEMFIGAERLSASLVTIDFEARGAGTRLTFTEQGAYVGGPEIAEERKRGTLELMDALAREVI